MTQFKQAQPSAANFFLKHRRGWVLGLVGLAIWCNLWWVIGRNSRFTDRATGLLRRSRERKALEPQENSQAAFMYSKTEELGGGDMCHSEKDAEYDGEEALRNGAEFLASSQEQCCDACRTTEGCNVWVFCAKTEGTCEGNRKPQECWLKKKQGLNVLKPAARRTPGSGWVSGAMFTPEEYKSALVDAAAKKQAQEDYWKALRNNETLPLVFFDVSIRGVPKGRIEMVLFPHISPRAAENFRQLCTGEKGIVPEGREGAGRPYHFKGERFYRIIEGFIDQGGANVESVFGGQFKDDPGGLALKHDRKGLLSMANIGPNTNTAHFSIMINPAPHLDGHYTIFGEVVSGYDVVDAINALAIGKKDHTAGAGEDVIIVDAGQIRKGSTVPDLSIGA